MSNKLDQALDDIVSQRRKTTRANRRRVPTKGTEASAPVGGVKKNTKQVKGNDKVGKAAAPAAGNKLGDSKIIVSNLPHDATEVQIKEFIGGTVGPVKRVLLTYGPNGQSRGIATITFNQADSAAKAAKEVDGLKIDNRPLRVEVLVGAKDAPAVPEPKKLSDRVSKPKNAAKPKPATETKATKAAADGKKGAAGRRGARRGRNANRPKAKTAEELDQEMADYFVAENTNANGDAAMAGGAVQPAANGDNAMADEIL